MIMLGNNPKMIAMLFSKSSIKAAVCKLNTTDKFWEAPQE